MSHDKISVPEQGEQVTYDEENDELHVPADPIIPIIHGDGIGKDVGPAAQKVLTAAAEATGHNVEWMEVYAGETAREMYDENLPRRRSRPSASTASPSRARSRRPSVRASAASTSHSDRPSTSTRTSDRRTTSTASRHR